MKEYQIFTAVIDSLYNSSEIILIGIEDSTFTEIESQNMRANHWTNLDEFNIEEIVESFVSRNSFKYQLNSNFFNNSQIKLIKRSEKVEIVRSQNKQLNDTQLESIYRHIGILSFSRVGFNKENNQALLYCEYDCGGLCGWGEYLFLKLVENSWKIVKRYEVWVA